MRYALIGPGNVIVRFANDIYGTAGVRAGWRWLECPFVSQPSFDPLTEIVEGPTYVVGANSVSENWNKRLLTAQEISDRKDQSIAALGAGEYMVLFRILFNLNNRVLTLQGQPTQTPAQFRATIKALL